ncbi:MAG: secondary thiamine-phosphate synthase enzyme YjbQ [Oscillospiraceae bacterium]|jgi:secondary thiamine-phosphate synthase enzyme|nr:secondary thiamine-phosphate synthase enzyme YjbQ [Oscillospiraceae bacterium]
MGTLIEFTLRTETTGVYNITKEVTDAIKSGGIESGLAVIFCPHTTAALTMNENTDINVGKDILLGLERAFPDSKDYAHSEGNSYAHIRSSMTGSQLNVIIDEGWPLLGIWQNIYFLEFDGPRDRKYYVKLMSD